MNLSAADFARRRNKHLAPIAAWVAAHGGGSVIPFSIDWEQQLWALRANPADREVFLSAGVPAGSPPLKSALPRAILTSYKELGACYCVLQRSQKRKACGSQKRKACVADVRVDVLQNLKLCML